MNSLSENKKILKHCYIIRLKCRPATSCILNNLEEERKYIVLRYLLYLFRLRLGVIFLEDVSVCYVELYQMTRVVGQQMGEGLKQSSKIDSLTVLLCLPPVKIDQTNAIVKVFIWIRQPAFKKKSNHMAFLCPHSYNC